MKIETKRLILREWEKCDADFLVDGLNDFNVAKNLTSPFPYTKQDALDYINKHAYNNNSDLRFAVVLKDKGCLIGGTNITLNANGEYRGGIWLHRNFQGQGYGTEIWIARAKYAFDILKIKQLKNGFYDFNERSKRMQQKIGYKIVGEKTNYCPALQKEVREIETLLLKEDFDKFYSSIKFEFFVK